MAKVDITRRSKRGIRGVAPLPEEERRDINVSVRLNFAEAEQLDAMRNKVHMQRGEYLRAAALHRLPPTIPELNRIAWIRLSKAADAICQIIEGGGSLTSEAEEVISVLSDFRRELIGAKAGAKKDDSQD